jgi:NodT family efflux transporter outer membrane factor (OMF) lipoprotein
VGGAFLLISAGCTSIQEYVHNGFKVGPNYHKPPAPVASEWIDSKVAPDKVKIAAKDLNDWWAVFQDPVLDSLVQTAYRQNLDVRTAGTRIMAARAQRNIAAGNLFPQLQEAFADVSRNAISGNRANLPPNIQRFFDNNAVGFNLAWEIDFWGRFRRSIEAADAELDASIENYDDALVLLISEVASNYVQIRVFQQRLKFAEENITFQAKLVQDTEDRLKNIIGTRLDVAQMRSNLTDTRALKEQLEIGLRLANNRLCVLLGIPVRDLIPELNERSIPVTPPDVVIGLPADLLRRRPDLRRAERLVAAQSARIGIATADLYPRISLLGTLGYEAQNFSDLFTSKSFMGSIGPNVRWDVLNYGRLVNGIRVQDALFQQRTLDYQNAVLRAGREVEDGIVQFLRAQTQTRHLVVSAEEAAIAAEGAKELGKLKAFEVNRLFVTSNFKTAQQDKLAVAQGDIALGLIQVYKALGGGWQIRCAQPAVQEEIPPPMPVPARGVSRGQTHLAPPQAAALPALGAGQ